MYIYVNICDQIEEPTNIYIYIHVDIHCSLWGFAFVFSVFVDSLATCNVANAHVMLLSAWHFGMAPVASPRVSCCLNKNSQQGTANKAYQSI